MALYGVIEMHLLRELERNIQKQNLKINQRMLRDASNPFELPDFTFLKLFRLNKFTTRLLMQRLEAHINRGRRSTSIPTHLKVLITLYFYGHGSYQLSIGNSYNFGFSQPSVSRSITLVTNAIYNNLLNEWIVFPNTVESKAGKKRSFFNKFNFPRCFGIIDCTLVAIIAPPENHPIYPALPYYNRKGYFSINVQIICDSDLNILNMNARFPGSVHDSAIWQSSSVRLHLEECYLQGDNSIILGDSGYPIQPWLMVPFEDAQENTPEERFNSTHCTARNSIERLNGVLKGRFRCLLKHRVLNYNPIKAGKIVYCCGILHNMAQHYNNDLPDNDNKNNDNIEVDNNQEVIVNNVNQRNSFLLQGRNIRNEIVQTYFT